MTVDQRDKFYFPAWRKCAAANNWIMERGRLRTGVQGSLEGTSHWAEPARAEMRNVLNYAEGLAAQEHRSVTAEDLRHACNLVATGGHKSSSGKMNNHETSRVVVLFRLLTEPDDVQAVMEWLHPELADKSSLLRYLKQCAPEATLIAIWRNAFESNYWERGELPELRWLLSQVKGRRQKFHAAGKLEENPF